MAASPATAALHGRGDELALLEACLDRAAAGTLQSVVVEGEAGIGKSRILEVALERARPRGFRTLVGRADELERGRPFAPLSEALARSTGADRVARLLAGGEGDARREPGLQFRVVDAFIELVEELALRDPIVIALDDLHWADPPTLLVVRSLGRRLPHLPVALFVTMRSLPRAPELEQLVDRLVRDGARHLRVDPLDEEAVAGLVADLLAAEPTAAVLEQTEGAGGNPLFVTELIRALLDEAAIEVVDGRAELRARVLPPSLRLTILRRLSSLDPETLEFLRVASVLGSTFSLRDLAAVMRRATPELVGVVSDAVRSGVLAEREDRLGFRHDLIREAIYEDFPGDVRAALHLDAGRRLARAGAPAPRVAEQLSLAGDESREAVVWLRRAADETAQGNPSGAAGLLRRALELLPDEARHERNAVRAELGTLLAYAGAATEAEAVTLEVLAGPHDSSLEGTLRATLVHALFAQGRWADLVSEVEAARSEPDVGDRDRGRLLAEAALARIWLGDLDAAARDAEGAIRLGKSSDDPVAVCFGLGHLSVIADQRGRFHEALALARDGLDVARTAGVTDADRRHPHIALGMALVAVDRLREARAALEEGRRLGERAGTAWDLPLYHVMLALPLYYLGEWDDALAEIEAGLALADELGSSVGRVTALALRGDIAVHRNDLPAARTAIGEALEIVERFGPQWGIVWLTLAHANLKEAAGEPGDSLAILEQAWDPAATGEWAESALRTGPALSRVAARADDRERVRAVAATMERLAKQADVPYASAGALLCRALGEADADLALRAVEAYRPSERAPELAAACEDAGRLLAAEARVSDARHVFEEALTTYERLGATRDTARALARMRELGLGRKRRGARKRPQRGWESLTPSELEVVRLAADGLTNPEIGRRLFISRRTVETHLRHAFRKLGLSSRVELAAEAARRGSI